MEGAPGPEKHGLSTAKNKAVYIIHFLDPIFSLWAVWAFDSWTRKKHHSNQDNINYLQQQTLGLLKTHLRAQK